MVNKRKCKNPYEMASSSKKLAEDHEITSDSASQYTNMPPEILLHIFKFMSLREMCRVARYSNFSNFKNGSKIRGGGVMKTRKWG
jgi:hypothetical protein